MTRNTVVAAIALVFGFAAHSLAANPSAIAALKQGVAACQQSRFSEAIPMLTAAINASKNERDAQNSALAAAAFKNRGDAYERLYQFDKALSDYDEAVRRMPRRAEMRAARGLFYAGMRQFDKALADCNESLRLQPKEAYAYAMRADVYRLKSDYGRALADASQALKINPKLWRAYQVRGRAYEEQKRYAEAVREFDQVIPMPPSSPQGYLARADTLYEGGDYQRAAKAFREAVRRFPLSDRAHGSLAWFLGTCPDASLRNGKEAVAEATKACEMVGWRDWGYVDALAAGYAEVGDFDRAVECMNRVLKMPRPTAYAEDERDIRRHIEAYKNQEPFRQRPGD